ncbi:nuclear transport factor 2 family protein [Paracoccus laeviglucosivorans]|uniref:Taurine dehydrogenase small subunit n=1 Tax=Paracoccus laeviglucosivorans TaxID=1197861 RepID=A0A521FUK9_9RHOB|nr:nuclear transport factor 2 family protein [Paracoccus laeviglucosivorans]SMO99853.1 taurine dehydrogenase small subunit [Paracoccus laeviglucosivorans]
MTRNLTAADLKATFDAFNRHDIDAVMTHFAPDCVFYTIGGDDAHGTRIQGSEAIARAFVTVWTNMPDVQWADHEHFLSADGTRGVSQWTFRATQPDGSRIEAQGVDLFRIRDGQIVEKQALRKQRAPIPAPHPEVLDAK